MSVAEARPLRLAHSPCPNDTAVFYGWTHGRVDGPPVELELADVDVTNTRAAQGAYDVVKVSAAALPWLLDEHRLLPCGGAIGRGVGPLVLTSDPATTPADLADAPVGVPGERTTAGLLLDLWAAEQVPGGVLHDRRVRRYDEVVDELTTGVLSGGAVIHEARFTYRRHGLHRLVDLGEWWEASTGLPLPLGAVLVRRDAPVEPDAVAAVLRASLADYREQPGRSRVWVLFHAAVPEPAVVDAHIRTYVTDFTADLGDEGREAFRVLLDRAAAAGLTPEVRDPFA